MLFEGMAAVGVYPVTTTYSRYIVGIKKVTSFIAVRGTTIAALAVRSKTGNKEIFDNAWRFGRFFDLSYKPIPDTVS